VAPTALTEAGGTVDVSVNAADPGLNAAGVASVQASVSGGIGTVVLTQVGTSSTYAGSFNVGPNVSQSSRTFTVSFSAADNAGNTAAPLAGGSVVQTGDTTPPALSSPSVSPATLSAAGGTVDVSVTATDNGPNDTGISSVQANVSSGIGTVALTRVGASDTFAGSFNVGPNNSSSNLTFTVTFSATDNAGNQAGPLAGDSVTQSPLASSPDITPPVLSNASVSPTTLPIQGGTVNFSVNATDSEPNGTGIAFVKAAVKLRGTLIASVTLTQSSRGGPFTGSFTFGPNSGQGTNAYVVQFLAQDNAGNLAVMGAGAIIQHGTNGP
jgi:hypothetical protein